MKKQIIKISVCIILSVILPQSIRANELFSTNETEMTSSERFKETSDSLQVNKINPLIIEDFDFYKSSSSVDLDEFDNKSKMNSSCVNDYVADLALGVAFTGILFLLYGCGGG